MGWVTLPAWVTITITILALIVYGVSMYFIYELGRKDERKHLKDDIRFWKQWQDEMEGGE